MSLDEWDSDLKTLALWQQFIDSLCWLYVNINQMTRYYRYQQKGHRWYVKYILGCGLPQQACKKGPPSYVCWFIAPFSCTHTQIPLCPLSFQSFAQLMLIPWLPLVNPMPCLESPTINPSISTKDHPQIGWMPHYQWKTDPDHSDSIFNSWDWSILSYSIWNVPTFQWFGGSDSERLGYPYSRRKPFGAHSELHKLSQRHDHVECTQFWPIPHTNF
jgi:hypothetical protein